MTEPMTTEPSPAPGPAGGLSPEQVAAARTSWLSHGLDAAKFDAAVSGTPEPTPSGDPAPRPVEVIPPSKTPQLTGEQVASMRVEWAKHGFDPAAFEAAMKADGIALDTPSAEQIAKAEHDADWGIAARDPSEFKIAWHEHGGRNIPMAELAAVNAEATSFLAALGLDPGLGAAVVERALDVGQSLKAMSADQQTMWKREQKAIALRRAGSEEALAERVAATAHAIRATGSYSGFVAGLLKAGAFDDAWVLESIANHGARIKGWQGGPSK